MAMAITTFQQRLKGAATGCVRGPCMGGAALGLMTAETAGCQDLMSSDPSPCPRACFCFAHCGFCIGAVVGFLVGPLWCCWEGFRQPETVGI